MNYWKNYLLLMCCLVAAESYAQLISGAIIDENRKLITQTNFTISGSQTGHQTFEIAVDRDGNVTSQRLISEQSSTTSTPLTMQAKNWLKKLTFEKGTHFPAHHHVLVRVNFEIAKTKPE